MDEILWDDIIFSVDIEEIDDQHKMLISMFNKLVQATRNVIDDRLVTDILSQLQEYSGYHFETEERFMTKFNFPGYDEHKREHNNFIKKVVKMNLAYSSDRTKEIITEVLEFMGTWIVDHVITLDQDYSSFFKEKGIKPL